MHKGTEIPVMNPPHHPESIIIVRFTSPVPTTSLFLAHTTLTQVPMRFAHCCASLTFSPGNSPGVKLIPETGNHLKWAFQPEHRGQATKGPGGPEKKENHQHCCSLVVLRSHGRHLTATAQYKPSCGDARTRFARYVKFRVGLSFLRRGGGSFYFCAVMSPSVLNSPTLFESTHSLLFLVCEWGEIVSIVMDLNFHFDDGNKCFSRPSLKPE